MDFTCPYGCRTTGTRTNPPPRSCETHGEPYRYEKALRGSGLSGGSEGSRKPKVVKSHRRSIRRGRGFAASPEQQKKVENLACLICHKDRFESQIHAAHVYPRRLAACNCAEGVVPLCLEHHAAYDDPNDVYDLLPALLTNGYRAELVHAIVAHDISPFHLLEQVTGVTWAPVKVIADIEGAV